MGFTSMKAQASWSLACGSGEGLKCSREWGGGKKGWVKRKREDWGYFHFLDNHRTGKGRHTGVDCNNLRQAQQEKNVR